MDEHLRLTSISRFHSETWLAFNYQLIEVEKTRKGSRGIACDENIDICSPSSPSKVNLKTG